MASPSLLNQQQIQALAVDVQRYLRDSLEVELGQFDVQFLLDFIIDKAGREIYNQALNAGRPAGIAAGGDLGPGEISPG